ncbi:MAG: PQ-loop repeat-containing protein [Acidimicrobiales bacterium]
MLRATELAGFVGAGMAGAAYVPQIWHLIKERCSAGLSRVAFAVWLASSFLVTIHAVAIRATVFIALGVIQLSATALILVYTTKYASSYCASHLPAVLLSEAVDDAGDLLPVGVAIPEGRSRATPRRRRERRPAPR